MYNGLSANYNLPGFYKLYNIAYISKVVNKLPWIA